MGVSIGNITKTYKQIFIKSQNRSDITRLFHVSETRREIGFTISSSNFLYASIILTTIP